MGEQENIVDVHGYWLVAFIDILGQSESMREIDFIPNEDNP